MSELLTYLNAAASMFCLASLAHAVLAARRCATAYEAQPARDYVRRTYTEHTSRDDDADDGDDTLADTLATVGAWQSATFGDGNRWDGILAHMRSEMVEISQTRGEEPSEWVDMWMLSCDGLRRCLLARHPHLDSDEIAELMATEIISKYRTNAARTWPDWRTADQSQPIEHVKGGTDAK